MSQFFSQARKLTGKHRVRYLVGTRLGQFLRHLLIELSPKYFFAAAAVKVGWLAHGLAHRLQHLAIKRFTYELREVLTDFLCRMALLGICYLTRESF